MSRSVKRTCHGYYRRPCGKPQDVRSCDSAMDQGVNIKKGDIPDAWDDIQHDRSLNVVYRVAERMARKNEKLEDIVKAIQRHCKDMPYKEAADIAKCQIDWQESRIQNIERNRKLKEQRAKRREIADEIIGDILKQGINQIHQLAARWREANVDDIVIRRKIDPVLEKLGVEYIGRGSINTSNKPKLFIERNYNYKINAWGKLICKTINHGRIAY